MRKINHLIVITALAAFNLAGAYSQNSTNSPYTRYGYGRLSDHSFGAGRSMGGTGIGLRSSKQINPMNPASYSSMDSLTFLFDFGASIQMSWFGDGTEKQRDINGNVDYMAMQFPFSRRMAMSIGLLPFSSVGYNFYNDGESNGLAYRETYNGAGGISQLYAGLSYEIWKKRLAVGANLNYLFGSVINSATTTYVSSGSTSVIDYKLFKANDKSFDFGLQYTQPISKRERLIAGIIYSPANKLNNENIHVIVNTETAADTIKNNIFELPVKYGLGFTYVKDEKLILAADVSRQEWSKIKFNSVEGVFYDRMKIAAGMEYIPNLRSSPFLNRVRYRAGLNYTNSYIKINDSGYKEIAASIGFGIPVSDYRSFINISFEYTKIMPDSKFMIKEDYARITLSYSFNEYWFFKRKVE